MNNLPKYKFIAKKNTVEGGYVRGFYIERYGKSYIEDAISHDVFPVIPETVRQLVGYVPGKSGIGVVEVYEGDRLINKRNDSVYATIQRYVQAGVYDQPIDLTELIGEDDWRVPD